MRNAYRADVNYDIGERPELLLVRKTKMEWNHAEFEDTLPSVHTLRTLQPGHTQVPRCSVSRWPHMQNLEAFMYEECNHVICSAKTSRPGVAALIGLPVTKLAGVKNVFLFSP